MANSVETKPTLPMLLRADEVAELLQIGRTTVYDLVRAGKLPGIRVGVKVRIPREALERWIEKNQTGPRDDDAA